MRKKSVLIVIVLILIVGIFIGRYSVRSQPTEKKPLYWVDAMEPTIHYPGPGKSRMGMELEPIYPEGKEDNQSDVRISPAVINNLGIRIMPVVQGMFSKRIETVGYIEPNENKTSHIHSYAEGWVKKLFVNTIGATVKKNEVLLQLYSPMLINAQDEYLIALDSGDQNLANASIKKLQALHISDRQIQQLKNTKKSSQLVDIDSPQDGVVTALNIREGMRVTPETEMISLVDLSSIWMIAQVFEDQANWLKIGDSVEAKLSAFPDKVWKGEVEYVYPQIDPTTRTLKIRLRFNNPDRFLKPNMYANVSILAEPKSNVISIPVEALIRNSEGDHVIVSLGNGQFQVHPVITGIGSGEQVEILSGLNVGENIVASGQFLIDSEANLNAGLQRIEKKPQTTATQESNSSQDNMVIEGKGIIKSINGSQNSLTLQHEPILALNWPKMTMEFSADKNIDINQLKIGDYVKFTLKKGVENKYLITDIKKVSP